MKCYLAVDMGGTNLRFGLVDHEGVLRESHRVATGADRSKDEILSAMKKGLGEGLDHARVQGWTVQAIGMGLPGCVDFERGFIYTLVNVPGWDNTPLAKLLEDEFHLPVFVDNDVNVMALGEHRFGAARGARNVICVTLGTGVGGGLILEGELYRGSSFTAGEIGHIIVDRDGPRCNCGNRGCLERFIGNRYLADRARELYMKRGEARVPESLDPEHLAHAALGGDEVALAVWREAALYLGIVLAGLVNFFNPDLIVIGGGVAQAGRLLFDPLAERVQERSMKVPGGHVRIKPAELGENAGLIGAATLAMEKP